MTQISTPALKSTVLAFLFNLVIGEAARSQQTLTTVNGMNAYVHLPDDYTSTSKSYPVIIFITGLGNVGTDPNGLKEYGPAHFIDKGHDMQFSVNSVVEKPIVISLQPYTPWPTPYFLDKSFTEIMSRWRIDENRVYLTGYSMGGWAIDNYVTASPTYAARPAAVVSMSSPLPNFTLTNFQWYSSSGGKWWGIEGNQDLRGNTRIFDLLNNLIPGSARYTLFSGGHCCWNTFYDPLWTENGESIYTWMLQQRLNGSTPVNTPPTANAGDDISITLPESEVSLSGSGSDADGSIDGYSWTKTAGPSSFSIASPGTASTSVSRLVAGAYTFQLTVTDNNGARTSDVVRVNVLPAKDQAVTGRVLIDLGRNTGTTDRWGKYWNNVNNVSGGIALQNAVTVDNRASGIGLDVVNRIDGRYHLAGPGINPNNTIGEIGDYYAGAVNDNAYAHNSATNGRWRIFGLDPRKNYRIKFWGTRSSYGSRTIQIRRADGASEWQEYNGVNNRDYNEAAVFENISGQSEAAFDIKVKDGETFGYISLIDITYADAAETQSSQAAGTLGVINTSDVASGRPTGFNIYPNPAAGHLNIQFSSTATGPVSMQLFNQAGVLLKTYRYDKAGFDLTQRLPLTGVPKGVYTLKLRTSGYTTIQRFVKL